MSKYRDSEGQDDAGGQEESEGYARSSRSMPPPEYMRRTEGHQGAQGEDEAPPPTYDEAVHMTGGAEGGDNRGEEAPDDSALTPDEIAVVLRMQSDRDQYLPESRSSYAEAIEMISPEENGEAPDFSQASVVMKEEAFIAPRAEPEDDSIRPAASQPTPHHLERGRSPERRPEFECTSCWVLNGPITWLGRYLKAQSDTRLVLIGLLVLAILGVILFVSLFPASFVYIEYYQVALPQSKMTNKVDRSTVYYSGCYVLGPDTKLVRFQASAHTITQDIEVYTLDTIPINIRYSLIYFLRAEEVGLLYSKFMHDYDEPFRLMVQASVGNLAATSFTVDQFRFNRTYVERTMHAVLRKKLGGDCCPECCPKGCQSNLYCELCKTGTCDRGYHVDAHIFNLLSVSIPDSVFERYLRHTILEIETEKEFFLQDNAVIKKETEMLTERYLNTAKEIKQNGTFEAQKVLTVAAAEKEKTVQASYVTALQDFFTSLSISRQDHKVSLMMIRAFEDNIDNLYTGYGFNESILFAH